MRFKTKEAKGITLIALVITIIVLLILAGVTIATLTGDNGILKQADKAKTETTMGEEKEAIGLAYNGAKTEKLGGVITAGDLNTQFTKNGTKATASGEETIKVDFETGRSYTLDDHGKIEEWIDIAKYVKVGDYVDYNPTITTKDGTTPVETSKLSYSSPIGTATEHGNGKSVQNFTATEKTRWRVLSIENGVVELISENVIKSDTNASFILRGAMGYLYAERELNEVCKIFGYGYGADTTKGGSYTTGGPIDKQITGKIEETGARSITIEDINKKAGIYEDTTDGKMKYSDGEVISSSYGSITNPTSNVYYPTVNGDSTTGKSTSAGVKNLKNTYYSYNKSKIENTDIQNMLFNEPYWLASRCISYGSKEAGFYACHVGYGGRTNYACLCIGNTSNVLENTWYDFAVRPVVTLKSDIIDVSTNYSTEGEWKLK